MFSEVEHDMSIKESVRGPVKFFSGPQHGQTGERIYTKSDILTLSRRGIGRGVKRLMCITDK
jgi:hypothetical protein